MPSYELRGHVSPRLLLDEELGAAAAVVDVSLIPFEFDPPGTYPPGGQDWTEYCEGQGC